MLRILMQCVFLLSFIRAIDGQTPAAPPSEAKADAVWVHGTVRDTAGNPIAGATVMALATYYGGIRMNQITSRADTDAHGHYEIKGQGGLPSFSATLIAAAAGHPPAWAWPIFPQVEWTKPKTDQPLAAPPTQDFVIPSAFGKLHVRVVVQGKPAQGVTVAVYLQNANLRDHWARPLGSASSIENAAYPMTTTDADGIAAFDCLLPGTYRIVATAKADAARSSLYGFPGLDGQSNEAIGIAVRVGETADYRMTIWQQQNRAVLKALTAEGTPPRKDAAMSFGPVDTIQWNTTPQFASDGSADLRVDHPGLWRVDVIYRDAPIMSYPISEPYFRASGHVAVSPNLASTNPPVATARWIEASSARITVQDERGKPLPVKVQIFNAWSQDKSEGTTDAHGEIVFHGLKNGEKFYVHLASDGATEVQMIDGGKFLVHRTDSAPPGEPEWWMGQSEWGWEHVQELHAEPAIMEQTFIARTEKETRLTMPMVPMTYVYGIVRNGAADASEAWGVVLPYPLQRRGAHSRYWQSSGRYLAGPFPPGEVTLNMSPGGNTMYPEKLTLTGNEHGPIRMDIDVSQYQQKAPGDPVSDDTKPDLVMMGMGGISSHAGGADRLAGKVYLSDGSTAALGAQVLFFPAHRATPTLVAMSDAVGVLQPRGLWYTANGPDQADGPDASTVIAFLPGSSGAVVQQVSSKSGQPLRLVLPKHNRVSGDLTIGGKAPDGRPGVLRVIATFQGKGYLERYLSVSTTADADGRFSLAGLTSGDYLVQASLDNIWTSAPVQLKVDASGASPVHLAIPSPGAPLQLHLIDTAGKAVPGGSIAVDRIGPMAALWPGLWTADGQGSIVIPTLEAGSHVVRVPGDPVPVRVNIPALPAEPVNLTVKIQPRQKQITEQIDPDNIYAP